MSALEKGSGMNPKSEEYATSSATDPQALTSRTVPRATSHLFPAGQLVPFILVTVLFFLWGIPNNLNPVLIRQFMKTFEISRFEAGLVESAFYMGYFLLAIPAAFLMRRAGYKSGFVTGLVLYGAGTFLFWPAALAGSYGFFLFALFVIASGLSFLETASNPFIAQLGDPDSSERRLNFAQAFNPLGAISGALIGTIFIFSGVELTPQQIAVRQAGHTYEAYLRSETVIAQFFYVGAQAGTWGYFISYAQEYAHQSEKIAGYFLTGTLAAFGVGRFASAWLMGFISPSKLMGAYSVTNIALVVVAVFMPGWLGLWCVFLTSFFMSLMFPTIFALGLKGLGPNTKLGGSLLVMAIVGGAILPPLMGFISVKTHSLALAYSVPLIAYLVIAFYSFWGSHQRNTTLSAN